MNAPLYRVIFPEMVEAYDKLMNDLDQEGVLFDSCDGFYEVGKLYAINIGDDIVYVFLASSSEWEYIDLY